MRVCVPVPLCRQWHCSSTQLGLKVGARLLSVSGADITNLPREVVMQLVVDCGSTVVIGIGATNDLIQQLLAKRHELSMEMQRQR